MKEQKETQKNIDDYISQFPKETQIVLEKLRKTIKEAAPEAKEAISYQMPTFKLNGNLVHFAAFTNHIGFYPGGPSAIKEFQNELSKFKTSKGTIRFPMNSPIPLELVRKIVEYRVKEKLKDKQY